MTGDYKATLRVVSALLYSFDPEGMGLSIFAPDDEYEPAATALISKVRSETDLEAAIRALYPDSPDLMIGAIADAIRLGGLASPPDSH